MYKGRWIYQGQLVGGEAAIAAEVREALLVQVGMPVDAAAIVRMATRGGEAVAAAQVAENPRR